MSYCYRNGYNKSLVNIINLPSPDLYVTGRWPVHQNFDLIRIVAANHEAQIIDGYSQFTLRLFRYRLGMYLFRGTCNSHYRAYQ